MATVPDSLIWEIVRKNNSFLVKQFGNGNAKVLEVHCDVRCSVVVVLCGDVLVAQ